MIQQGQVFKLKAKGSRRSAAVGVPISAGRTGITAAAGGWVRERIRCAEDATEGARSGRSRPRRRNHGGAITLAEVVEEYLALHQAEPVTIAKLRWLLSKATNALGEKRVADLVGAGNSGYASGCSCLRFTV